jgi:HSP20 family protein
MFGLTRANRFDDFFNLQRDVDRMFNEFWNQLPARTASNAQGSLQVSTTDDGWRIDVPLPGIDPQNVALEAAGNTLSIRVEEADERKKDAKVLRFEQTMSLPQFLDLEKLTASHRHGMLQLNVPLKESVKPRRIQIEGAIADRDTVDQKQLKSA